MSTVVNRIKKLKKAHSVLRFLVTEGLEFEA
jgi:hypothetical protein